MNVLIKICKYIFDKIIDLIKYVIESTKLTLKKIKVLFFAAYMAIFSFNYFIDLEIENGKVNFKFDPQNVPYSSIIISATLILFLIVLDIIDHHLKRNSLERLVSSPKIPLEIKNKAIDELIKQK